MCVCVTGSDGGTCVCVCVCVTGSDGGTCVMGEDCVERLRVGNGVFWHLEDVCCYCFLEQ